MTKPNPLLEPILPTDEELETIQQLAKVLKEERSPLTVVGEDGKNIPIPESVRLIMQEMTRVMAKGRAIQLQQFDKDLSIGEVSDLLRLPPSHILKLLESGELPHHEVHSYPRICFKDAMAYKEKWRKKQRQILAEMTQESQELGFYD